MRCLHAGRHDRKWRRRSIEDEYMSRMPVKKNNLKKIFFISLFLLAGVLFLPSKQPAYSWGFFGHQKINRMAVFTLPEGMIGFYKQHIEYISAHAVDPDKRRYANADEAPRHYIDIDHYGEHAFDSVPHWWKKAVARYTEDTLKA